MGTRPWSIIQPATLKLHTHNPLTSPVLQNPYRPLGPWYVAAKDPQRNVLYVTNSPDTLGGGGGGGREGDGGGGGGGGTVDAADVARCVS